MDSRKERAMELFRSGCNCSQSVFLAFADKYGIEEKTAMKLSASFGGGLGRMRKVCGAVSGMSMVIGMETGAEVPGDFAAKKHNYENVQRLAGEFAARNGSIICRELLGLPPDADTSNPEPERRTAEYYKKRPCMELIGCAAELLETMLFEKQSVSLKRVQGAEAVNELAGLADEVWHEYFVSILSPEQIDYMVEQFQSVQAMTAQMEEKGYEYYFILSDGKPVGYTAIQEDKTEKKLFLSKLYLLGAWRGKGYASQVFAWLWQLCGERGLSAVWLTVNRYNANTIAVYEKKGFQTIRSQVTDIGNGYVMDDFVMEKTLTK